MGRRAVRWCAQGGPVWFGSVQDALMQKEELLMGRKGERIAMIDMNVEGFSVGNLQELKEHRYSTGAVTDGVRQDVVLVMSVRELGGNVIQQGGNLLCPVKPLKPVSCRLPWWINPLRQEIVLESTGTQPRLTLRTAALR